MARSETTNLLKQKILKILGFLILIRLGLYIPVPNIDLDIFAQNQVTNPFFGFAKFSYQYAKFIYGTGLFAITSDSIQKLSILNFKRIYIIFSLLVRLDEPNSLSTLKSSSVV